MVAAAVADAAAWPSYAAGKVHYDEHAAEEARNAERLAQAELLREMFGGRLHSNKGPEQVTGRQMGD
jgi:hypothetical protein